MSAPKFQWNRLLPANQIIVQFRHKLIPEPVYYLLPDEREARRAHEQLRNDPDVDSNSIICKEIRELFPT
jgi:hypothetical protein